MTRPFISAALGRMDGTVANVRLLKFAPQLNELAMFTGPLIDTGPLGPRKYPVQVSVADLAWIGFLKETGDAPEPHRAGAKRLKVHVAGGALFSVEVADATPAPNSHGFTGWPLESNSPYREVFFYEHGINLKETADLLGQMLVDARVLSNTMLAQGVAKQNPPLGEILIEQNKVQPKAIEEAVGSQQRKRMRLGEILVEAGLATEADITLALAEQKERKGRRLGEILVAMGTIKEEDLARTLAAKFNIPFIRLDGYSINPAAAAEVGRELIERHRFLPLETDSSSLTIAIGDPLLTEIQDLLRFKNKTKRIREVVAMNSELQRYVDAFLSSKTVSVAPATANADMALLLKELEGQNEAGGEQAAEDAAITMVNIEDSAVIKLANQIIIDAYQRGASDVHVEPRGRESPMGVRFRIDGDCIKYQLLPPHFRNPLVARLKIMAKLDIAERRKPQDGKIRLRFQNRDIELRVATIPTVNNNEDVVMRILAGSKPVPLAQMGFSERNFREIETVLHMPHGLVLCVGPTGSGKTTTLHSMLGSINTEDMKIWTAEDPVEITQDGLRQVQVQPKIGFTFAAAMRAFLRADPDVIMVGEMRDQETAAIAVEASLTGHLVLSTLHTNSAPETITRLIDMGIEPFTFADALLGVVAQRLARRLCSACKKPAPHDEAEIAQVVTSMAGAVKPEDVKLWRAQGCPVCGSTGYKGRLGLHELLIATTPEMKTMIQRKTPVGQIRGLAIEQGMTTLLQDGLAKALRGDTDVAQVMAVCGH